ncbi:anaerobic sulfatase maturase [Acidobacteria bacterium AB60]|nr:anaerobic sulfatase maturase [Acidobacteria bacterium AB60]
MGGFHIMTKPIGPLCNLDCAYCFYLEKERLYPGTQQWAMPEELLERYVREYIAAQPGDEVHFAWQGGEPTLLGVEFFRTVVALEKRYAGGKVIHNALQTNGTLLDDAWGAFLAEERFLVGISIDGPRQLHDRLRVDKGQAPTFDRVLRGLETLKEHGVAFNTLTVVNRYNAESPLEVYGFLKEIGSGFLQLIPVVERAAANPGRDGLVLIEPGCGEDGGVTDWSVQPLQYGLFLTRIFDEWVRNDVGRVYVQQFEVALESWLGLEQSLCVFRPTCGGALAMEHNGDVYSCDHFVYPEHRLGNLRETSLAALAGSMRQHQFGQDKAETLPGMCRACEVRFACNGECPKHRFARTPEGEPGLNYLCAGYKHFFRHIDPYMRFMGGELRAARPATSIMNLLRSSEAGGRGGSRTGGI